MAPRGARRAATGGHERRAPLMIMRQWAAAPSSPRGASCRGSARRRGCPGRPSRRASAVVGGRAWGQVAPEPRPHAPPGTRRSSTSSRPVRRLRRGGAPTSRRLLAEPSDCRRCAVSHTRCSADGAAPRTMPRNRRSPSGRPWLRRTIAPDDRPGSSSARGSWGRRRRAGARGCMRRDRSASRQSAGLAPSLEAAHAALRAGHLDLRVTVGLVDLLVVASAEPAGKVLLVATRHVAATNWPPVDRTARVPALVVHLAVATSLMRALTALYFARS